MEKFECPYAQEVGSMQSEIATQKIKLSSLQAKFDLLTVDQIREDAKKDGLLKGMKIAATVIGYFFIAVVFVIAVKTFGLIEVLAKILKL